MRLISFSVSAALVLMLSAALAQQPNAGPDDRIGHPPPLPGPPPVSESPTSQARSGAAAPQPSAPTPNGYTGAYQPAGTPSTPYSTGPLPQVGTGTGLSVPAPDGVSSRTVKAVPCGLAARETDGFTTCVGIPDRSDQHPKKARR